MQYAESARERDPLRHASRSVADARTCKTSGNSAAGRHSGPDRVATALNAYIRSCKASARHRRSDRIRAIRAHADDSTVPHRRPEGLRYERAKPDGRPERSALRMGEPDGRPEGARYGRHG